MKYELDNPTAVWLIEHLNWFLYAEGEATYNLCSEKDEVYIKKILKELNRKEEKE